MSSLVSRLGWDRLMAPVHFAFDALGPVNAALARRMGLAPDTPVYCGMHDSNASLLPHLLHHQPPFTVVSTGTWVIVLGVGGALEKLDAARDTLANVDAFGRPVPSARFMGGREYDLLTGSTKVEIADSDIAQVLDRQVMLVPAIVPSSGPFPRARGGWANEERPRNAGQRAAVATLYLALMTETCMRLAGTAGAIAIEGPMAQNQFYCQALATVSGRPVQAMSGSTGTSAGAALLARGLPDPGADLPPVAPVPPFPDAARLERYAAAWKRLAGTAEGLGLHPPFMATGQR